MSGNTGESGGTIRALLERLEAIPAAHRRRLLARLSVAQREELSQRWQGFEHAGQREPCGDWRVWLIRAGRGFGKTRAGAEWVSEYARAHPDAQIALVGATMEDARRVMVEGRSGLLGVARA